MQTFRLGADLHSTIECDNGVSSRRAPDDLQETFDSFVLPIAREGTLDADTRAAAQRDEGKKTQTVDRDGFSTLFVATKQIPKGHLLQTSFFEECKSMEEGVTLRRASSTNRTFSRMVSFTARTFF